MPKKSPKRVPKPMSERKLRSGFERKVRKHLELLKVKYKYESMVISYTVPETSHKYVPDFTLPNGVIVESKGYWDAKSRAKMAMVIEQHPELDIRMLFQRDNTLSKKSKTKYSDWCQKRGIKYAVSSQGIIPEGWLV
jgi:hypothetical protein